MWNRPDYEAAADVLDERLSISVSADYAWPHFCHAIDVAMTPYELVDIRIIAGRLDVPNDTVNKWRYRGVLPDPDYPQLSAPTWEWETIRQWAEETGRLRSKVVEEEPE